MAKPNIKPIAILPAKITSITMSSWRFSRRWDLLFATFAIKFSIRSSGVQAEELDQIRSSGVQAEELDQIRNSLKSGKMIDF